MSRQCLASSSTPSNCSVVFHILNFTVSLNLSGGNVYKQAQQAPSAVEEEPKIGDVLEDQGEEDLELITIGEDETRHVGENDGKTVVFRFRGRTDFLKQRVFLLVCRMGLIDQLQVLSSPIGSEECISMLTPSSSGTGRSCGITEASLRTVGLGIKSIIRQS
jgi:hypothetical protein